MNESNNLLSEKESNKKILMRNINGGANQCVYEIRHITADVIRWSKEAEQRS